MHILIIGAAGMVGRKLTARLVKDGTLAGKPITALTLADVIAPEAPAGTTLKVATMAVDISDPAVSTRLVASRPRRPFPSTPASPTSPFPARRRRWWRTGRT